MQPPRAEELQSSCRELVVKFGVKENGQGDKEERVRGGDGRMRDQDVGGVQLE